MKKRLSLLAVAAIVVVGSALNVCNVDNQKIALEKPPIVIYPPIKVQGKILRTAIHLNVEVQTRSSVQSV